MSRLGIASVAVSIMSVIALTSCDSSVHDAGTTTTSSFTLQPVCAFRTADGECVDLTDYVDAGDVKDGVEKLNELIESADERRVSAGAVNHAALDLDEALSGAELTLKPKAAEFLERATVAKSAAKAEAAILHVCAAIPNRFGC